MRRWLALLALLVPVQLWAQSTTVSGTVVDIDGQAWFNGSVVATFVPAPSTTLGQYTWSGGAFNPGLAITTTIGSTGSYSVSIPSNTAIIPGGSKWTLTVSSGTTSLNTQSQTLTIVGATQTQNFVPAGVRISAGPGAVAYLDLEVSAQVGQGYFQLNSTPSLATSRVCQVVTAGACTTWTGIGGGGGTADPPVTQNYTLTTTGAQAAINLTAAPIDTHSIQWRLVGSGNIQSITDSFAYSNGDLHAANANWVYQAGSFTVSTNIAYSSASGTYGAYRSDGPNTANEYAQDTMVMNAGSGTQVAGPCVRMQAGAATGYCVDAANDTLRIYYVLAGSFNTLLIGFDNQAPITGDVLKLQVNGSLLSLYKNSVLLGSVTDTHLASGFTGIVGSGNATSNGVSSFQSGTLPSCTVALDSSVDGINWLAGGIIAGQPCVTSGSVIATQLTNYVRVNVTALTAGQTLNVIYSGRLAPAASNGGAAPVSNGQWVQAGEVIWTQITSLVGTSVSATTVIKVIQPNGTIAVTNYTVNSCNLGASGGQGSGITISSSGWLQSVYTQVNTGGFAQGTFYIQHYILESMPFGGGSTGCSQNLAIANFGTMLDGNPTGSFYTTGFTGTTVSFTSPWSIPGFTTTQAVTNPSAGAEWTFTFPGLGPGSGNGARSCVQSVSFQLVAGSTNVTPALVLTINGSTLVYSGATAQTSGTTQKYSFSPGAAAELVTAHATPFHIIPFNNGQLACFNAGLTTPTIGTSTVGINGTTQYSAISILIQVQNDND